MKKYMLLFVALLFSTSAQSYEFGGVEFPQGSLSFADEVVLFDPWFNGGPVGIAEYSKPEDALGIPDRGDGNPANAVTVGNGGRITLKFVNNLLTGSGDSTHDLHIFEVGGDVEDTFVELSKDGIIWHSVGKVYGATSSIDIDAFGFTVADKFEYVRLTDDPDEGGSTGDSPGADIDAVGAISASRIQDIPELDIETSIMVKIPTLQGSVYALQVSTNLVEWSDEVIDIVGDGTTKKHFFEITTPRQFYRVKPLAE